MRPAGASNPTATTSNAPRAVGRSDRACVGALQSAPTQKADPARPAGAHPQPGRPHDLCHQGDHRGRQGRVRRPRRGIRCPRTSRSSTSQSSTGRSSSSQSSTSQSSGGQSSSSQSSGGQTGGSGGQSDASRVVTDQAAITKATAALSSAQADLASATLKSSIAGTVGSVGVVTGSSSTGKHVAIVGAGAVAVTLNVPLASMATIHVGQKANVTPQGATSFVPGAVTSISLLPSTSTSHVVNRGRATTQAPSTGQGVDDLQLSGVPRGGSRP